MKYLYAIAAFLICASVAAQPKVNPTDSQPTCYTHPGTFIPVDELNTYTKKVIHA